MNRLRGSLYLSRGVLLVVLLSALAAQSTGATLTYVRSDALAHTGPPYPNGDQTFDSKTDSSPAGAALLVSSFAQIADATASADAAAELGFLRGQAFATYPDLPNGDADSGFEALWRDDFTIFIPGHTGEVAFFDYSAVVDGFVDAVGSAQVTVRVWADPGSGSDVNVHFAPTHPELTNNDLASGTGIVFGHQSFIVGEPFEFGLHLFGRVIRYGSQSSQSQNGPGSGDIQLGNTVTWSGIDSVTLASDPRTPVAYSFSSASGVDFRNSFASPAAVPEPEAVLLVLSGLAVLAVRRRLARPIASRSRN